MSKKDKKNKNYEELENNSGNGEDLEEMMGTKEFKEKIARGDTGEKIEKELEVEELKKEIELLREELENCKKIEEEYIDRIKRIQADYDNYRKRTLKEHLEHIKRANKDLIEKLLPVIDNFEIALEAGEKLEKQEDDFYKGVKMIYDNLMELLKKENVKVINPVGEEFNPEICDAVLTESVEGVEEGRILEVLRKGYMIDDFLIRPAVVKVCKHK
ncbi:MAG: nucleotide exchange factor GrpE [Actinomycetota bacterium]|nr:nucleotide exchange factor GrpE [Actinomycetota bacterium]